MKYLYFHALGQKPDSWDRVIKETTVSDRSVSLSLAEMLEGKAATYGELYTAFSKAWEDYVIVLNESSATVAEAAHALGVEPAGIAKTLLDGSFCDSQSNAGNIDSVLQT